VLDGAVAFSRRQAQEVHRMIVVPPITKRSITPSDRECVFIVSLATHIQSIQCGNDSAPRLY